MEQSGNDWLEWRRQGIGASDAPIIMNASPWSTPFQLWQVKTGLKNSPEGNWATRRGQKLESAARAQYELETGIDMPPQLAVHSEHAWLRASLDGFNAEHQLVLEIKCPGKDDHALAMNNKIPEKYVWQLQHQLMVTGAKAVHYYSFDGQSGKCLEVLPNTEMIERLFMSELDFWEKVQMNVPPELGDNDTVEIEDPILIAIANEYAENDAKIKELEKRQDEIKDLLQNECDHKSVKIGRVIASQQFREGAIDYKKIEVLKNVDLNQYRKKGTSYFVFKIAK